MLNRNDAKKTTTVLSLPLSAGSGDNLHPQILKRRDQKKNECLGGVKSHCYMFLVKKDFVNWNMILRAKLSNVNLGLF